jgi:hypothetical protein
VDRVDPAGSIWKVPAESGFPGIVDIASLSDGAFAVTAGNYVMRLDGGGSIRTIAGSSDEAGFGGDGGPARRAALSAPTGIEPTGHGGLVIADTGNDRVRLIDRNGDIHTLAGGGPTEWCEARSGYFRGDGRDPRRAALCGPIDMVRDPMGGWLIAHQNGVSFLASPDTRRMGVAITRPEADRGRLTFVATTAGSATVEVRRRRQIVETRTLGVSPGTNSVRLPRRLAGIHRLTLRARNANSTDADAIGVLLGGHLSRRLGQALVEGTLAGGASNPRTRKARAADGPYEYLDRCHQFGSRRVDCVIIDQDFGGCSVRYVRLLPSGLVRIGSYRCVPKRRFRAHIPASSRSRPLPL